ncbi:Hydroxymethylpyrimidine phosphate synthase ThiC [Dissulfuribacter thermophilus]|uniref:Phosphomethylpyrimidine synthase n=1 Tax=Dissulfuribacter thermophilus TaxID=1156395 RepID=A0A1B9F4R1_9BACT|nr:phosphomethylpyrimidine synthase ThiC [Dissulfuribacter thermophilus]OCC14916.1 Hydroxymethylpyrimidine phosphate synthase ThiC [Dissulfuribacter thermophilus]
MNKTLLQELRQGIIPEWLNQLAEKEEISLNNLVDNILKGEAVVLGHRTNRGPMVVGKGVKTKVNANIGASTLTSNLETELRKLKAALKAKADAVMDLSLAENIKEIRKKILASSPVPVGTVPIYEEATLARTKRGATVRLDADEFFTVIEDQMKDGVDFVTVHCGVTKRLVEKLSEKPRLAGIVSRGGAITAAYIKHTGNENPLYEYYDRLLDIAEKYDCVLSLGDGMRPGAINDASDFFEVGEQEILGELQKRAFERGVMTMIEGPGHVPLHLVAESVKRIKALTNNAPLYLLGPLVTDIAPGYDHITSAIGAAVAGMSGADFICYVTPSEHLGLPSEQDVFDGVIASRIAAHAADITKGLESAIKWDEELSIARRDLDWDRQIALSIDPEKARRIRKERSGEGACTMCGEYCVFLVLKDVEEINADLVKK